MTTEELLAEFRKLTKEQRLDFLNRARNMNEMLGLTGLRLGVKVHFVHSKTGATISGEFLRMKQKYAEIKSDQDKFGRKMAVPMTWNVPPHVLIQDPS